MNNFNKLLILYTAFFISLVTFMYISKGYDSTLHWYGISKGLQVPATKNLYITFMGRFGNVIFQFAAAYGSFLTNNCTKMFFKDNGQTNRLKLFFPKLKERVNLVPSLPWFLTKVNELAPNKYHQKTELEIAAAATTDVHLYGYLGVPTYWWPKYEKLMMEVLTVSQDLQKQARTYLFEIAASQNVSLELRKENLKSNVSPKLEKGQPTLVGIHVRRGDKVTNFEGWLTPGKSYFAKAQEHFRKKFQDIYFIVVSEDKNWAKQNIQGSDVIYSMSTNDLLELALLTLCDHTIMSVGTFSWWAAFLAGGDAVYYRNHTKPNTIAGNYFNDSQYFLPHWKPIN